MEWCETVFQTTFDTSEDRSAENVLWIATGARTGAKEVAAPRAEDAVRARQSGLALAWAFLGPEWPQKVDGLAEKLKYRARDRGPLQHFQNQFLRRFQPSMKESVGILRDMSRALLEIPENSRDLPLKKKERK